MKIFNRAILAATAMLFIGATPSMSGEQKILSLLSAAQPEAQAFSLILSNEAKAAGNPVDVVLCGAAGDIALKQAPSDVTKAVTPNGMSVQKLLERLIAQGGKVEVCAIYLPNRKLQPDALIAGVTVGKPADVSARLADPAIRVLSN